MLSLVHRALERLLQAITMVLMVVMTAVVVIAVAFRFAGDSLSWYDEIASQLLAWLTYYGACLAALKRGHIGFDGLIIAVPIKWRLAFVAVAEVCVFGFFAVLAWTGWVVLQVLEGDNLVSLPQVSVQITQSVIPITAVLFMICEALSLPDYWRRVSAGVSHDEVEAAEAEEAARQ